MIDAEATLLENASRTTWDVIFIGGGPAGALSARLAALAGLKTLLAEAKRFPREKVCGGYLNHRALRVLQQTRLEHLATAVPQSGVNKLKLVCGRQRARFELPAGRVICRATFDTALLESAKNSGATVLTGTQAVVEPEIHGELRSVRLVHGGKSVVCPARVVVSADGLARTSVRQLPEIAITIGSASRVGIGTVVRCHAAGCFIGQVTMVVSRHGYVGVSRTSQHQVNVAAAIAPESLARGVPAEIVATMLGDVHICEARELGGATWRGTPPLTSRPLRVAGRRLFLIGDAAGYVEPFTGEGIASALETAVAVTPLVVQAARTWTPSIAVCWETLYRETVRKRQLTCRQLAWILRHPRVAHASLGLCRLVPGIARRVIRKTTFPSTLTLTPGVETT